MGRYAPLADEASVHRRARGLETSDPHLSAPLTLRIRAALRGQP